MPDDPPAARPPLPLADALRIVADVARLHTYIDCACAPCPVGVRASRAPDGLCARCRAAGCEPWTHPPRVACREAGHE